MRQQFNLLHKALIHLLCRIGNRKRTYHARACVCVNISTWRVFNNRRVFNCKGLTLMTSKKWKWSMHRKNQAKLTKPPTLTFRADAWLSLWPAFSWRAGSLSLYTSTWHYSWYQAYMSTLELPASIGSHAWPTNTTGPPSQPTLAPLPHPPPPPPPFLPSHSTCPLPPPAFLLRYCLGRSQVR